jgi:hypothetical protein
MWWWWSFYATIVSIFLPFSCVEKPTWDSPLGERGERGEVREGRH